MGNINLPELETTNETRKELQSSSESLSDSSSSRDSLTEDQANVADKNETKVEDDFNWRQLELEDLGIRLDFENKTDAKKVNKCKIVKLSMEERSKQLEAILTGREEFLVTDIFKVVGPKFNLRDDVTVTVTLGKHTYISQRHKIMVKMKLGGKWVKEDATIQDNQAVFRTKHVEQFVLVGDVITTTVKISPEGSKVKVDETSKMEVEIPAGAVDADQDIDFQIIPPGGEAAQKYLKGRQPICKTLVGVTECIYGSSSSGTTFKKPVTVKLPLDEGGSKRAGTKLVMFRMEENEIRLMDPKTQVGLNEKGICSLQVSGFSGYFAGFVKSASKDEVENIENEARILFGKSYPATILLFKEKQNMPTGFPKIWIEIVDKVNAGKTVEKRTKQDGLLEIPNSRSPDVLVHDGYRLRIQIDGNLKGISGIPSSHYLMTYLDVADDNHKVFTVEAKDNVGSIIGSISFYSDVGNKKWIHAVHVNTVVGFNIVYRSQPS